MMLEIATTDFSGGFYSYMLGINLIAALLVLAFAF